MFDPAYTTLISSDNDLANRTIIEIAQSIGMDVRILADNRGEQLYGMIPNGLQDLRENILIVEMPAPNIEEYLRTKGHHVITIDHRRHLIDGKWLERYHPKSALEQFADLTGHMLTEDERLVALNDHGGFYAMVRESRSTLEEMLEIQERDLFAQGYTEADLALSKKAYEKNRVDFNQSPGVSSYAFSLVVTSLRKTGAIANLCQKATSEEIRRYRESGKECELPIRAILILSTDEPGENVLDVNYLRIPLIATACSG